MIALTRLKLITLFILSGVTVVLALLTMPGRAQTLVPAAGTGPHIRAVVDAETLRPRPGDVTTIAIRMTPEAGWHGYWLNGGDAGFGMQIEWDLPAGVTIGELAYPVPDTLIIAGLMNHVYERPYALIAPLTLSESVTPGTSLSIRGEATWLACTNEICVPERGTLLIDLVAGDGSISADDRARFDEDRSELPPPISAPVHYALDGQRIRFAIPMPASLRLDAPHLFIATRHVSQPGAPQAFSRSGDMLIVETAAGEAATDRAPIDGVIRMGAGRGLSFAAVAGIVPPAGTPLASATTGDDNRPSGLFWTALVGAIIGGLILNIMPCVFPILSLKALSLARAGGDEQAARTEGLAYTAGAVLTALALGTVLLLMRAGGEAVGWAFQLQRPESVVLLIVLMAAITANLAGLFELRSLSFAGGRAKVRSPETPDTSVSGARNAFATGALAAFVATPCSGPFLGAALGATLALPIWAALPIFAGLGLGLALPFLAIALVPGLRRRLPRPGPWMETMRRWLAVPMALTALALIWLLGRQVGETGWLVGAGLLVAVAVCGWWAGRLQLRGQSESIALFAMAALIVPASLLLPQTARHSPSSVSQSTPGVATPWSEEAEAQAIRSGRPTFIYFTADWCVSCKVNEAAAINRDDVQRAFSSAGVNVLVADWTSAEPAITRRLENAGRNSVPVYLWIDADGTVDMLPQILTPAMLIDRAQAR